MDLTSRMLMMAAPLGREWQYMGNSGVASGTPVVFPVTTQANDLAIIVGSFTTSVGAPTGFTSWDGNQSSSNVWYRVCGAGETSATHNFNVGGSYCMIFRPKNGGVPTLTGANSSGASINYTSLPSLICAPSGGGSGGVLTLPGSFVAGFYTSNWEDTYNVATSGSSTGAMSNTQTIERYMVFHLA